MQFNQSVEVKTGRTPGFRFQITGGSAGERTASYTTGSGTKTLRFQYTVSASDPRNDNGIWIGDSSRTWTGAEGNIKSSSGAAILDHDELGRQSGHKVNPSITRPSIDNLRIISQPLFDVVGYGRDEQIKVQATFSEDVVVTGSPSMAIQVGGHEREAQYINAESSGTQVVYGYTVRATDSDANGVSMPEHALADGGDPYAGVRGNGTIRRAAGEQPNARLRSDGIGNDGDHKVAGNLRPLGNASLSGLSVDNATLTPAFDKNHESYAVEVGRNREKATIRATPRITGATVTFSTPDINENADGHQTELAHGVNDVDVLVGSVDNANTRTYTVALTRAPAPPEAPEKPTVTALSPTSLHVIWTEPANNAADITGYAVRYQEDEAQSWESAPGVTATVTTINNLSPGVLYRVQINATNSAGTSAWSPSGSREVSVPDAPQRPMVTIASPTSIDVEWTTPENNGLSITHYRVRYRETGTSGLGTRGAQRHEHPDHHHRPH